MGIMVYSLLWVMQELYHQPYLCVFVEGVFLFFYGSLGLRGGFESFVPLGVEACRST